MLAAGELTGARRPIAQFAVDARVAGRLMMWHVTGKSRDCWQDTRLGCLQWGPGMRGRDMDRFRPPIIPWTRPGVLIRPLDVPPELAQARTTSGRPYSPNPSARRRFRRFMTSLAPRPK